MDYIKGKGSKNRDIKKNKTNNKEIYNNKHVRRFELIMEKQNKINKIKIEKK
jgi:hypothetical protein